jgi:hypothetical protein
MKIEDIKGFTDTNVQRIIAHHTAQEAAEIIVKKWGEIYSNRRRILIPLNKKRDG